MFRNSILYRRLWYVRKRNIKKIRLLFRLAIAAIGMWIVITLAQHGIFSFAGF